MDVLSADLREGRSEPCVYLGEEEEWGRGAASAETTRQRVPQYLTTVGRPGRLEAGWTATVIKLFFSAWCVYTTGCTQPLERME